MVTPTLDNLEYALETHAGEKAQLSLRAFGSETCKGTCTGFSAPGTYNIAVYAMDRDGNISIPKATEISQTGQF